MLLFCLLLQQQAKLLEQKEESNEQEQQTGHVKEGKHSASPPVVQTPVSAGKQQFKPSAFYCNNGILCLCYVSV